MQPRSELQALLAVQIICDWFCRISSTEPAMHHDLHAVADLDFAHAARCGADRHPAVRHVASDRPSERGYPVRIYDFRRPNVHTKAIGGGVALIAAETLDPTSAINIRHYSPGYRLIELRATIGARKPAAALPVRVRVVDMPRAMPPGDLIRRSGKVTIVHAKEVLAHLA
jgi:hypothetical protein